MDAPFKAIADPSRRRILRLVAERERSAGDIAEHFAVTRPAVSQHLTALKRAGLIEERRQGTRRLYRARPQGLAAARWFLEAFWDGRLARLEHQVEEAGVPPAGPMSERLSVTRRAFLAAPPTTVWAFLTDPQRMGRWMGRSAELDPTAGGRYRVEVVPGEVAAGVFLEVDAPHRLAHTWGWEGDGAAVPVGTTLVSYELTPVPGGTLLRLEHRLLPGLASTGSHSRGWEHYLERLAAVAAGGAPGPDPWVADPRRMMRELRP